jgi:hypothetical protein
MAQKRARIEKPKTTPQRRLTEVLPLDARDPDILRVKSRAYATRRHLRA